MAPAWEAKNAARRELDAIASTCVNLSMHVEDVNLHALRAISALIHYLAGQTYNVSYDRERGNV